MGDSVSQPEHQGMRRAAQEAKDHGRDAPAAFMMRTTSGSFARYGELRMTLVVVVVVLLLCGCTMWRTKRDPGWNVATSADQYERLMWEAVQKQDYKEVERHLSSTFVASSPAGTLDRAAALQHLRLVHITSFEMSNVQTTPAGNDTVVTYLLGLHGRLDNQPLPADPMRVMAIWQSTRHGWLAIAQSVTPAADVTRAPGQ